MLLGNIGSITLGQMINWIITFASVLGAGGIIVKYALGTGQNILDKKLKPFKDEIDAMNKKRDEQFEAMQLQVDKNYLVNFLSMTEDGKKPDEVELEHFWFTYDDYKRHNGNSYISHKVDKLKKEGKL